MPPPSVGPTAGPIPPYVDALVTRATARDASLRPPDARSSWLRHTSGSYRHPVVFPTTLCSRVNCALHRGRQPAGQWRDRADYEVTQMVPSSMAAAGTRLPPPGATRTVIDAPPPPAVPRTVDQPTAERLAASERERRARKRRRGWLCCWWSLIQHRPPSQPGTRRRAGSPRRRLLSRSAKADAERVASKVGLSIDFSEEYSETVRKGHGDLHRIPDPARRS